MECNGNCRKYAPDPACPIHGTVSETVFRELSQALPEQATIVELVVKDLEERADYGMQQYGVPLLRDSRKADALQEAYEEALDLCIYLRLELARRTHPSQYQLVND